MIALLQRVAKANVQVENCVVGAIDAGLLVFICAERHDTPAQADALLAKIFGYRVFNDAAGKMNRNVVEVAGGMLVVPQFTLAADTRSGTRPSFTPAAAPDDARRLFDYFVDQAKHRHADVQVGRFGAHMQVELINDGPVTFWLRTEPIAPPAEIL